MIAVVHAYSRANAGDSLLVDLTLARLASIGVAPQDVTLIALDAGSFADLPNVVNVGTPGRAVNVRTFRAVVQGGVALAGRGEAGRVLATADACVAVGGGYLRAGRWVNRVGTSVNHLAVLASVARSGAPSIYLPQSVGPLRGIVGTTVRRLLARMTEVHLRDDRSLDELRGIPRASRTPDLAVLDVADSIESIQPGASDGRPVIAARALPAPRRYLAALRELESELGDVSWAVQAEGSASKSDQTFYDRLGVRASGLVRDVLARGDTGPVVSVRLHGALHAIRAGIPAIHLGYERKSWGAYEDLGLPDHVHNARDFDARAVAEQVRELQQDPSSYWAAISARVPRIREQSHELNASLARACGRPPDAPARVQDPT